MPRWRSVKPILLPFGAVVVTGLVAYAVFSLLPVRVPDAAAAILSAGFSVALASLFQRQREIEAAQRTRKITAYNSSADHIYDTVLTPLQLSLLDRKTTRVTLPSGKVHEIDSVKVTTGLMEVSKEVTMWGSDEIIKYYADYMGRVVAASDAGRELPVFDEYADLFMRLRRDVGYENAGIGRKEFHRLFGMRVADAPKT
jgi:hypothetical protein